MAPGAPALVQLTRQVNAAFPRRSTRSDGWIGDARHQGRDSDHNPWLDPPGPADDIVTAHDYTHDPGNGFDCNRFADQLAASRDVRIKYVIWARRILDSRPGLFPWQWRPYGGPNPHTAHCHVSVMPDQWATSATWRLPMLGADPVRPPAPAPTGLPVYAVASRTLTLSDPYMRGTDVRELQRVLNAWYPTLRLTQDGVYGPATEGAVRVLQRNAGISVDGRAGAQTFRALRMG